jgi:hypothetical protein
MLEVTTEAHSFERGHQVEHVDVVITSQVSLP